MKTPYPDSFIKEMKDRLLEQKGLLEKELSTLGHPTAKGEYVADFPDYGRNDEDNATEMADYEATRATTKATQEQLKSVEAALSRIEQGEYGLTDDGQTIPEARLRANPAATTLV